MWPRYARKWDLFCTIWPDQLLYNQNKRMFSYNLENCDFAVFYILIYSLFETQRLKLILSMAFTNHDNLGLRSDCQIKFWKKTSKDYPSLVWIKLTQRYKRKMFTKICKNSTLFAYLWQNPCFIQNNNIWHSGFRWEDCLKIVNNTQTTTDAK